MRKPWALWGQARRASGKPRATVGGLRRTCRGDGARRLRCEALEDRRLLTAYTVNSLADVMALDGVITLREALQAANTNAPAYDAPAGSAAQTDSIRFDSALSDGTISLGGTQLEIKDNLAIQGLGAESLRIDAGGQSRVFSIASGLQVSIWGLSIAGGAADLGAGIYCGADTTLYAWQTAFVDNAASRGGGIFNNGGSLDIAYASFAGNSADDGAGILNAGASAQLSVMSTTFSGNSSARGGGVFNELGTLNVGLSTLSANTASEDGGGGLWAAGGTITVTQSTFFGNSTSDTQGHGGAIRCADDVASGTLSIVNSTFANNAASGSGGALYNRGPTVVTIANSPIRENSAALDGGGIANAGTLSVTNSLISANSAGRGGGIYDAGFGTMSVTGSTIASNTATNGGGVYGDMYGTLTVTNSTITDNEADEHGGGILSYHLGTMSVVDCTVARNTAGASGGGAFNSGTLSLTRAMLIDNAAASGGGIHNDGYGTLSLVGSTLARNAAQTDGGAIYNAWMLGIADCTIKDNTATNGGGVANAGTLSIATSTLADNIAQLGGAIANRAYATLTVTFSTLKGNTAQGYGGAIDSFFGTVSVISSIMVGNTAAEGGAVSNRAYGVLRVTNSTLAGNKADYGGGICNFTAGTLLAMNSIVARNEAIYYADLCGEFTESSTGNVIDVDPRFVRDPSDGGDGWGDDPTTPGVDESANDDYGDLHVASGSAAINAGSNEWALDASGNPLVVDWDDRPRVIHVTVDAGVYEYGRIGDANGDDLVNGLDAAVLASHWLKPGNFTWDDGDFNGDGHVDELDLAILAANWSPPAEDPANMGSDSQDSNNGDSPAPADTAPTTSEEPDARFVGPRQLFDADRTPRRLEPLRPAARDSAGLAAPMSAPANGVDAAPEDNASTADAATDVPLVDNGDAGTGGASGTRRANGDSSILAETKMGTVPRNRLHDQVLARTRDHLPSLDEHLAWLLSDLDSRASRRLPLVRRAAPRLAIDPILVGLD